MWPFPRGVNSTLPRTKNTAFSRWHSRTVTTISDEGYQKTKDSRRKKLHWNMLVCASNICPDWTLTIFWWYMYIGQDQVIKNIHFKSVQKTSMLNHILSCIRKVRLLYCGHPSAYDLVLVNDNLVLLAQKHTFIILPDDTYLIKHTCVSRSQAYGCTH